MRPRRAKDGEVMGVVFHYCPDPRPDAIQRWADEDAFNMVINQRDELEAALREAERNMLGFLQRLTIEGVAVVPGYQAAYLAKDIEAAVVHARQVLEDKQ